MIGKKLEELIKNKGISSYKLAKELKFNKQTILNYIENSNIPTLDKAKKIADYFGVSIDYLISTPLKDEGYSLYHYTTAENLIKILENMTLKFSNFNNSNDPNERTLYYRHGVLTGEKVEKSSILAGTEKVRTEKEAKKYLEENYKFISFCKQPKSDFYTSKRVTLPRMWSQYGTAQNKDGKDNKSYMNGACIELDFTKIISKSEKYPGGSVNVNGIRGLSFFDIEYKNESEYYKIYNKEGSDKIKIEEDVKFKYKDWSEESEFRAFYNGYDGFLDISDCIERIYLGADFRHESVVKLCNIMASKRYGNIHPFIFTRIMISQSDGLLQNNSNNGGDIQNDMLYIIQKEYPNYFKELKIKYQIDDIRTFEFDKKREKEQREDEEKLKLDAEHWKNRYISLLEENRVINAENRMMNNEIKDGLNKMSSLKDTIHSLEVDKLFEEQKNLYL